MEYSVLDWFILFAQRKKIVPVKGWAAYWPPLSEGKAVLTAEEKK